MKYFHGTTDTVIDRIIKHGLFDWPYKQPAWLSASFNNAIFFAHLRTSANHQFKSVFPEELGGQPVVVTIDVPTEAVRDLGSLGIYAKTVIPPQWIVNVTPVVGAAYSALNKRSLFYPGWMGIMETAQFLQRADDATIAEFKKLVEDGKVDEAWTIVERYWHLPHRELGESPDVKASIVLYASLDRFANPILNGIPENETLTDSIGVAVSHKGAQVVAIHVPLNLVEDVPSDNDADIAFYTPKASISPLFVRAVYNPWARRSFKVTANSVSFCLEDLLNIVTDPKEMKAIKSSVQSYGLVHPVHQASFLNRITPYLAELHRKSGYRYPLDHLFWIIKKGMMIQDQYGNYAFFRYGAEMEDTLQLSVGDIVKDINTSTSGEVIAISKMHHEADIDIVVRWDQPINGQTVFEVHPNEIKFVRHKTENEIMKDMDLRYYEESVMEDKGLKTRLDYGLVREAGQFFVPGQFQMVWDDFSPGLDYYRAIGHIQMEDKVLYWAVDNDTRSGELQVIDPEEIHDGLIDFRTILKEEYEQANEMINEANQMISEVANARFERVKTRPASDPKGRKQKETEEEIAEEEGGEGAGEAARTEPESGIPALSAGAPTQREPHLNGFLASDDGSQCVPFIRAYSVWVPDLKRWQVVVYYREPTRQELMPKDMLEVADYLNRRSLCEQKTEQPST